MWYPPSAIGLDNLESGPLRRPPNMGGTGMYSTVNHPDDVLAVANGEVNEPRRLCDPNDFPWSCVSFKDNGRPVLRLPLSLFEDMGRLDWPNSDMMWR